MLGRTILPRLVLIFSRWESDLPGGGVRDIKLAELRLSRPAAGHADLLVILDEPPVEPLNQGTLADRHPGARLYVMC